MIGLAVAEKVNEGQNTMSPAPTPAAFNAIWIAAVPEVNAAA